MLTVSTFANGRTHVDDVVAVEVTIDGMLVIADRLHMMEFPPALGIRPNIPQLELRNVVWDQVARDLTAQGVLDVFGAPHPEVAGMVDTLSRADRTMEGRWWRRDVGGKMVRFAICRKGDRHVIAARDCDMIVLQRIAPQVGLAGMVTAILGSATPADVEPLTGVASKLGQSTTANQLAQFGIDPPSARLYAEITGSPDSWVEITANERHPGGTYTQAEVAAGVLDSRHGRIVSLPRHVNGELYGSLPLLGRGAARRGGRWCRPRFGSAGRTVQPAGTCRGAVRSTSGGSDPDGRRPDECPTATGHRGDHAESTHHGGSAARSERHDAEPADGHLDRCALRTSHGCPCGTAAFGVIADGRGAPRRRRPGGEPAGMARGSIAPAAGSHLGGDDGQPPRHRRALPRWRSLRGEDAVATRLASLGLPLDPHQPRPVAR